jgi:cell division protein FtsW
MKSARSRLYPSRPDYWLLAVTFALVVVGLIVLYSAAMAQNPGNPSRLVLRQATWAAVGIAVMAVLARVDYHRWTLYSLPLLFFTCVLLLLVLIFGEVVFGSRRWVVNGSVQPSELMKLALTIYVAYWLSSKGDEMKKATHGLIPFTLMVGFVTAVIMAQPDFSTAMLIAGVALLLFVIAGVELWQVGLLGLVVAGFAALLIVTAHYRVDRVNDFQAAMRDPLAAGYHIRQTVIALGSGGLTGRGLGNGVLKFGHLPAANTDSIFAVIGEELGFVGCVTVVALFALFAWRGIRIATQAEDAFGSFLAAGLVLLIVVQAALNIAVVTATVPYSGLPLPFISAGGSSLVMCLASIGIIFNISGHRVEA